ncbi:hypothetical protein CDAR_534941 [Caerostris darwini]|uniref:Uncharacterized protein n=1 Tax=Caerostris darwini TaxID=1538125 RepID=A0AAV4QIH1_9ARAC|nr:hypothetical protein CDAR_534941 [Caerostris darwini]
MEPDHMFFVQFRTFHGCILPAYLFRHLVLQQALSMKLQITICSTSKTSTTTGADVSCKPAYHPSALFSDSKPDFSRHLRRTRGIEPEIDEIGLNAAALHRVFRREQPRGHQLLQ